MYRGKNACGGMFFTKNHSNMWCTVVELSCMLSEHAARARGNERAMMARMVRSAMRAERSMCTAAALFLVAANAAAAPPKAIIWMLGGVAPHSPPQDAVSSLPHRRAAYMLH